MSMTYRSRRALEEMTEDLRYALRGIRRSPGFSLVVVATLAVGIGINAAVFAISGAFLLRGFPLVEDNDRIAYIASKDAVCCISYPDFEDLRDQATSFSGMEIVRGYPATFSDADGFPEVFDVTEVSAGTFGLVGQAPLIGRDFTPADAAPGAPAVAILGHGLWQRRYGGDPAVLGRTVRLDDNPTAIVGVMPRGFSFPQKQELWLPIAPTPQSARRDFRDFWFAFGRLRDGVTMDAARAEIETIGQRLAAEYPLTNRERDLPQALTFNEFFVGPNENWVYASMWGAVAFVLLIACANLANLMLARSIGRTREIAVRVALGAGPARIVRQLLTESVLLAAVGGLAGWWFATGTVRFYELAARGPGLSPWRVLDYTMNSRVLLYLGAVTIGTGLLFGIAPASRLSRLDVHSALKASGRATQGAPARRLTSVLVTAQIALAVVLLAGAGVMVRSFINITTSDAGIDDAGVVTAFLNLPARDYPTSASRAAFYDELVTRLEGQPAVESVALANTLPTLGAARVPYALADAEPVTDDLPRIATIVAGPGYFRTLRAALVAGRPFADSDGEDAVPVAIVNRQFADRHWPDEDPIGRQLELHDGAEPTSFTVVGVVANIAQDDPTRQSFGPLLYVSYRQRPRAGLWIVARTALRTDAAAATLRREIRALDDDLPIRFGPDSLADRMADAYADRGLYLSLFLFFALTALALAAVGLYAVMAHSVDRHTREIGVRMAIGATARDILRHVIGVGLAPTGIGLVLGLVLALVVTRVLRAELVQVSPSDPATYLIAAGVLATAAALGCLIPARRAMRVDPVVALRHD